MMASRPASIKAFHGTPFTTVLATSSPYSSLSSSLLSAAVKPNFNRFISTNAAVRKAQFSSFPLPAIMVAATLNAIPQVRAKNVRPEFKMIGNFKVDDDLGFRGDDSRSNHCFLADYGKADFVMSGNNQFEDGISAEITDRMGKDFTQNARRRSFWAEMKIAVDETASPREGIMVTWVISYFKFLLSLTIWKNMFKLINVLLVILLMPFNGRRPYVILAFDRMDKKEKQKGIVIVKKDKQVLPCNEKGPTVKMPVANPLSHSVKFEVLVRRQMAIQRVKEDKDDANITAREFSLFVSPRGVTLFTQSWTPISAKIKGFVLLLHGLNEHSGRYNSFAKQLNTNGFKVYGLDWIGHGGSDGLHGYVHSLDDAVSDVKAFMDEISAQNLGSPCFCFGHSTGGAILLKAALDPRFEAKINGLILTSPAIGVQASHPIYTILAPIMSILLPRYQCGAANKKGAVVSRDPEALVAKYSDPLVYTGSLRVRTGYEILRTSNYLKQNLRKLKVPILVLHGTADVITNPKASEELYMEASSTDKKIKLYEGLLHDLLFEPEREAIIHDIMEWLVERTELSFMNDPCKSFARCSR
ncbi:hypothetical protein V2J09_011617 [Rumex salicifolius]